MARILLCHLPKDGSLARELGSALMGRGHFVSFDGEPDSPRPDRSSRLRQFEAVIVLWTEISAQSAGLSEIARETMPLNLLVPVRVEDLKPARLPLMFRKLNMLAPRDIDGIARVVARLSAAAVSLREMASQNAQRAAAAPKPAATVARPALEAGQPLLAPGTVPGVRPLLDLPEVDGGDVLSGAELDRPGSRASAKAKPPADGLSGLDMFDDDIATAVVMTASGLEAAMNDGLVVHRIPATVALGVPVTVELSLDHRLLSGLAGGQGIETLSISLYGAAHAFEIERQSERTQFIAAGSGAAGRDPATLGRWAWLITPRAIGAQDLVVRVSALLRDRNGVPGPVAVPDRRFAVEVELPQGQNPISAMSGWRPR